MMEKMEKLDISLSKMLSRNITNYAICCCNNDPVVLVDALDVMMHGLNGLEFPIVNKFFTIYVKK